MRLAQPAMAGARCLEGVTAKRDRGSFGDLGVRTRLGAPDLRLVVIVAGTAIGDDTKLLVGIDAEGIAIVLASLWMTPPQYPSGWLPTSKNTPLPRGKTQYARNTTPRPSKNSISNTQASIAANHRRITAVLC
jgi:hypothetical protein